MESGRAGELRLQAAVLLPLQPSGVPLRRLRLSAPCWPSMPQVRVHAGRLLGTQSLARHVGWKGERPLHARTAMSSQHRSLRCLCLVRSCCALVQIAAGRPSMRHLQETRQQWMRSGRCTSRLQVRAGAALPVA